MTNGKKMRDSSAARQGGMALAWIAIAILGQYSAQQLVAAGPSVRYQHYLPFPQMLGGATRGFVAVLVVQAVLVGIAFRRLWPQVLTPVRRALPGWRVAVVTILFVGSAAALRHSALEYSQELAFASILQIIALCNVIVAAAALPSHWLEWIGKQGGSILGQRSQLVLPGNIDRFAIAACIWVLLVTTLLSVLAYQRHPHIPDEVPYLLHARYFAAGSLYLPRPPVPEAFDLNLMFITSDKWFSPVPPGWPAVLSLGVLAGIPWMVNPILAALNIVLSYMLLRELYSLRSARLAVLLLCVSPWYLFMGMNFMTHMASLFAGLVGALAVARAVRTGRLQWLVAGGAATGLLSLIRPLEGLIIAVLLAVWVLLSEAWSLTRRMAAVTVLGLSSVAVGAVVLPYNRVLSGSAFRFPLNAYVDAHYAAGSNDMGFGSNRGLGWPGLDPYPGHGAVDVVLNALLNFYSINVELLGWASGSALGLAIAFAMRGKRTSDRMMIAAIVAIAAAHSFYWFSGGPDFGARYWFLAIVPCAALAARAIEYLGERESLVTHADAGSTLPVRLLAGVALLSGMALLTFVPWRAIDKYHHYRGMRPDIRSLARENDLRRSLVLIRGRRHPDYASAAVYNPLDLSSDAAVYVWARSPDVEQAAKAAFPDRRVVIVEGPTITGNGFRLAGPSATTTSGTSR